MSAEDFTTITDQTLGRFRGDNCYPVFHYKAVLMENASQEAGQPVYKDIEYVQIIVPGSRKSEVDRKVRDEDKKRWPQEYAAWKAKQELPANGMPLEKWTLIAASPAMIETLRFHNVRTVEHLAGMTDSQVQECGRGVLKLREQAVEFLAQAKGNAGISKMAAEKDALEARVVKLERDLGAALKALEAEKAAREEEDPPAKNAKRGAKGGGKGHELTDEN